MSKLDYAAFIAGNVASIFGATILAAAWSGEAPKKSSGFVGVGLIAVGSTLALVASSGGRS